MSSSCSRKARSQTSGSPVRPPHLSPHGLTGKTREFSHQETEVLFGQFPRCRGPHPAWSCPSPPWTRAGPATVPLDRAGVEVGETGVGPAPELQPLRAGQSRAEADTGRAAFLSEGHGGPFVQQLALSCRPGATQGGVPTVPGTGREAWALEKERQGTSPRRCRVGGCR